MEEKSIFVTRPSMPPYTEYIEAIKSLWESHKITNMGIYHRELEKKLKEYLEVPKVSLMVNGHMALELTIQAMRFPAGSEVITTPFTFVSTTHAIVRNNLKPVFCDVKEDDGTLDEKKIEDLISKKTVAIIPVHVYGHICNVRAIDDIARKHGLKVIYDAAHSFGERYENIGIGNFGDASVFSFHATKIFNTIEGGAVTFSDTKLYENLYDLKNFGIQGEEHVASVGANAKLNEFCAIMGLCNLQYIDLEIEKRKKRYDFYIELLSDIKGIRIFRHFDGISYNYAYFPILVEKEEFGRTRDEIYDKLRECNIYSRKYFYPLTVEQECYRNQFVTIELRNAKKLSMQILTLPLYADIEFHQIERICMLIRNCSINS